MAPHMAPHLQQVGETDKHILLCSVGAVRRAEVDEGWGGGDLQEEVRLPSEGVTEQAMQKRSDNRGDFQPKEQHVKRS